MSKNTSSLSESDLIELLIKNDRAGFEYLYDHYSKSLLAIILRTVKNENTAEDVLQDVFVKIWKNIGKYDSGKGRLYTWMVNLTKNQAIDKTRSKDFLNEKRYSSPDTVWSQVRTSPTEGINPDHIGMFDIFKKLTVNERQLAELFYYQGYTHTEISAECFIPLGTVKSRLRSANASLRKITSAE